MAATLVTFFSLLCLMVSPVAVPAPIDLSKGTATVLLFVAVDCPISNGYLPELNRIIDRNSAAGVRFVAVYSDAETTPAQAAEHAKSFNLHFPWVIDRNHTWMKRTGVTVTPEAAVLTPDARVQYAGRIDNLYVDFGKKRYAATSHDLQEVLDAVIGHQPIPKPQYPLVGCPIFN